MSQRERIPLLKRVRNPVHRGPIKTEPPRERTTGKPAASPSTPDEAAQMERQLRLLASTDIALRILIMLGERETHDPISADTLARDLGGLSRNHLHKIIQDLTALGITRTTRGAGGGVSLARLPTQIQIGQLIRHLEADQSLVECFRPEDCACTLMPSCRLRGMLGNAQRRFYESLDDHTLADCLSFSREMSPITSKQSGD